MLLAHHLRKMEGEEGTQAGGSRALAAAVDILLELRRSDKPNRRLLTGYSRFDETPASLVIELGDDGYAALGDAATVQLRADVERVWDALPEAGEDPEERDEIARAAGVNRGQVTKALRKLDEDGRIERTGAGKRGEPHKFRKGGKTLIWAPPKEESGAASDGSQEEHDGQ